MTMVRGSQHSEVLLPAAQDFTRKIGDLIDDLDTNLQKLKDSHRERQEIDKDITELSNKVHALQLTFIQHQEEGLVIVDVVEEMFKELKNIFTQDDIERRLMGQSQERETQTWLEQTP